MNEKKRKLGSGGVREGSGRKDLNKGYGHYYISKDVLIKVSELPKPSQFVEDAITSKIDNANGYHDLEKLYEWIIKDKRPPANTHFTSSLARKIASEIEFIIKQNDK